jgi:hypothetical protein
MGTVRPSDQLDDCFCSGKRNGQFDRFSGDVDFYVARNTANDDMARTGDIPYFETFRVSPGSATPVA